eukprot:scaffold5086_cov215-Prasinococcus_capsulatus_cf.AAC.2
MAAAGHTRTHTHASPAPSPVSTPTSGRRVSGHSAARARAHRAAGACRPHGPVLPIVPSVTSPPARRWPRCMASWSICAATRSFTEPPGLTNSTFARMSHPVASESDRMRTSGVLPMAPASQPASQR